MSIPNQKQNSASLCLPDQHVIDWDIPFNHADPHPGCGVGRICVLGHGASCPMAILFSTYQKTGFWDANDPKHRACYPGQACSKTGEKLCARILYIAKHNHAYGACSSSGGPDHEYCPPISDLERRWLFPDCSECGLLNEARALVLIHRRMLDECVMDEGFTDRDVERVKNSLVGYMRAYGVRRGMHIQELREQSQAAYELEMRYARGGEDATCLALGPRAGRCGWWGKTAGRVVKAVARFLSF
ncbi:hypothetical protein CDEST_10484 [Colletotrichum destructivum]|uniref:Uncharacterized protein n=1 Tax=Colletotrichum destructivum TaxID=34406 RepID=A0AAX4IQK2_9PEZI|nr:hypothetical protein CDEST_10484 [Colletotrichum destructivum]